jgi:hypothetical protein
MSDFKFTCSECGQKISCDTSCRGRPITCPSCGKPLTVPAAPAAEGAASPALVPLGQTSAPAQSAAAPNPPPPPAPPALRADQSAPARKPSLWELASAGQPVEAPPAPPATGYSILAMASLFCSVWVFLGFIPGIICGHLARAKMRENPLLKGAGLATAGLAISYAMLLLLLTIWALFLLMAQLDSPTVVSRESTAALEALLLPRIVDEVKPGPASSGGNESGHNLLNRGGSLTGTQTNNYWRTSFAGGAFSYDLKVLPDAKMSVNCRYYSGAFGLRLFDIIVDDQIVGTQELTQSIPAHYFDVEYKIPASVTKGKSKVTVEFQAREGMSAGGIFAVQTLRR